jgi:hypothetical protein
MAHEYRALWAFLFRADLRLWGVDPVALHVTNLVLHLLASSLTYSVAAKAVKRRSSAAMLALAFFVVAPVHEGAVGWIAARGHILVTVFILATLLLFMQFRTTRCPRYYFASLLASIGALMSQELSVTVAPLILLYDLVYVRLSPARRVGRSRLLPHVPYWGLLAAYLVMRQILFGSIERDEDQLPSPARTVSVLLRGVRNLWLSPTMMLPEQRWLTGLCVALLLFVLIAPCLFVHAKDLAEYGRGIVYFGICWPVVTLLPLFGAYGQRHLYLASVGVAVATGIAAAHLFTTRRRQTLTASSAVIALLVIHGALLGVGVRDFAANGQLSSQLLGQVEVAAPRIESANQPILVVIPELPDKRRVFWAYALRFAVHAPFLQHDVSSSVLPSLDAYGDDLDEWAQRFAPLLTRISDGDVTTLDVIELDRESGSFVRRTLRRTDFLSAGYLAPDGPLMREGVRH